MAGRKPKPSALKISEGNPGKRAINRREPKPDREIPECPVHLDLEARNEWARITPELLRCGLLTLIDRATLASYCQAWSRWADAELNLQRFGAVIKTAKGYPIQNPYLGISNTAQDIMRKCSAEFGMTPSSRSRITAVELPQDEDIMELLSQPRPERAVQ